MSKTPPPPTRGLDPLIERGLPANPQAEVSVLGACLLDPQAYGAVAALNLKSDDFSVDSHRRIYQKMISLQEGNPPRPIDFTTLTEELLQSKELEAVGGMTYLSTLTDGLPRAVNVETYARIVLDKSMLRRLIHAAHQVVQQGLNGDMLTDEAGATETAYQFAARAAESIFEVTASHQQGQPVAIGEIVQKNRRDDGAAVMGLQTGFRRLDDMTRGLHDGDFIIIAARPSMGKTSLSMNIAHNVAKDGFGVGVFSLEMTKEALTDRMVTSEARVDSHKWQSGFMSKEDYRNIDDARARIVKLPIYIDDTPGIGMPEFRAKAQRLKFHKGIRLIILDYLQLCSLPPKVENQNIGITRISQACKSIAKSLGLPVVVLSQLNRGPETRGGDGIPKLSDLRDSGSLEQDADLVVFIHRQEYYERMKGREIPEDIKGRASIIIAKQRNGPTGTINLAWMEKYTTFTNIAEWP